MPDPLQTFVQAVEAGDDTRAEETAGVLKAVGDQALPALQTLLRDPDPHKRWWAPRALAALGTDAAVKLLIEALDDPDPDVRACAVVALSQLKPQEAILPLITHLSDPSAYVGRLTADAVSQFGHAAVEPLVDVLKTGNTAGRAGAARALCAIQPEEAIPALYRALDDASAIVSYYAEEALEKMGVGMFLFRP